MRENELKHFGVIGMKWGVRRYQNYDSTLIKNGQIVFIYVPKSKQQLAREEYNFGYKEIADNPNYRQTLYKD